MSYQSLRTRFRDSQPHIRRHSIRDGVLAVTGANSVREIVAGMDTTICRGMYLSPRNQNHPLSVQFGGHIVVVARGLDRNWYRFVYVKELMHMLDSADTSTDSGVKFDTLLTELGGQQSPDPSSPYVSEVRAFWMALGLLCLEPVRQDFLSTRNADPTSDFELSLKLKIPEAYVPLLASPLFEEWMDHLA